MNAKVMSVLVLIFALATLSIGVPIEESKELNTFLAQVNGTTCFSGDNIPAQYYGGCFQVCVMKNGVRICYQKCTYSGETTEVDTQYYAKLSVGRPTEESNELNTFLAQVNGTTCFSGNRLPPQYYGICYQVCVMKNGVRVCYQKCTYSGEMTKVDTQYDAKCKLKLICITLPNGRQACSYNCI